MKKTLAFACLAAAILSAGSCAKAPVSGKNDLTKRYFDAWTITHYPNAPKTYLGSVIIRDEAGTGALVGSTEDTPYVYCDFQSSDLAGNISTTSSKRMAQQLGSYSEAAYYGPRVVCRVEGYLETGIAEMMQTMRVGGTRTAAIPGWLMSTDSYDTPDEYLENCSGTDAIWTFSIQEAISDIVRWEIDSVSRFMARHYPRVDSLAFGYYYIQTAAPLDTNDFDSSSSVYINYTGRLLNGQVFDSTIEDTTKRYRIHTPGKTYEPATLTWPDEGESVTFSGGSSMITGFEKCIRAMRAGEKGICVFYSGLGYGLNSTGNSIPPISPLMFEVQMLGKNEDGSLDD